MCKRRQEIVQNRLKFLSRASENNPRPHDIPHYLPQLPIHYRAQTNCPARIIRQKCIRKVSKCVQFPTKISKNILISIPHYLPRSLSRFNKLPRSAFPLVMHGEKNLAMHHSSRASSFASTA